MRKERSQTGFCSECHEEAPERVVLGQEWEPDTNAGGWFYGSSCCHTDLYRVRVWDGCQWHYFERVDDLVEREPVA